MGVIERGANSRCLQWEMQDTRISRGDGGSVFVLVKDVSFPSDLPASTTAIVPIADTPQASGAAGTATAPAPYLSVGILLHSC